MNNIFSLTNEYRNQFIDVLKKTGNHYDSIIREYVTPNNYNIKYYKWQHPYQGNWEYEEIFTDPILNYFKNLLNPKSVVIDIGAQAGLMSVLYAQFANKVISFEPNPAVFEVLEKNSIIYKNIIPYNLACSTDESILEFHYSDQGFCNGGFATACNKGVGVTGHIIPMDVYAINLNNFLEQYHSVDIDSISLIKIDAEGHDKEILKTLKDIINKAKPTIITEMYAGLTANEINELLNVIFNYNYKIYDITKNNSGLGIIENRKEIKSLNDVKIGELCNFLCLPR